MYIARRTTFAPHCSLSSLNRGLFTYSGNHAIPCVLTPLSCTAFPFLSVSCVPVTDRAPHNEGCPEETFFAALVGSAVGAAVGVLSGAFVGVGTTVPAGVFVAVGMTMADVGVAVGISVPDAGVGVAVGISVPDVGVGVAVGMIAPCVGVTVGVDVSAAAAVGVAEIPGFSIAILFAHPAINKIQSKNEKKNNLCFVVLFVTDNLSAFIQIVSFIIGDHHTGEIFYFKPVNGFCSEVFVCYYICFGYAF